MADILASNDIVDYRGYQIVDFGDYFEVTDKFDDMLFGIYNTLEEAEHEIDFVLNPDEDAEVLAIEKQYNYNKSRLQDFAKLRGIYIDNNGNVFDDIMENPKKVGTYIQINYRNLSSMLRSFNRYNGTTFKLTDTGDGFKVMC